VNVAILQIFAETDISPFVLSRVAGVGTGSSVQVLLGDAATVAQAYDNQAADTSANEVRTESALSVNGTREARGDISATVVDDALLRLTSNGSRRIQWPWFPTLLHLATRQHRRPRCFRSYSQASTRSTSSRRFQHGRSQGRPDLPCRHPLYNLGALDRTIVGNLEYNAPAPLSTPRVSLSR